MAARQVPFTAQQFNVFSNGAVHYLSPSSYCLFLPICFRVVTRYLEKKEISHMDSVGKEDFSTEKNGTFY